jgi:hypothetical protein
MQPKHGRNDGESALKSSKICFVTATGSLPGALDWRLDMVPVSPANGGRADRPW